MIYTVTFNPSLDYIVTVPHFTCGMVNRTSEEKIFPGGKGINVSMVLKKSWTGEHGTWVLCRIYRKRTGASDQGKRNPGGFYSGKRRNDKDQCKNAFRRGE